MPATILDRVPSLVLTGPSSLRPAGGLGGGNTEGGGFLRGGTGPTLFFLPRPVGHTLAHLDADTQVLPCGDGGRKEGEEGGVLEAKWSPGEKCTF